jgi:hypothetical protein
MKMVIPDEYKTVFLDRALAPVGKAQENWSVQLFTNNYFPADDSTFSSFVAATFAGSAAVVVDPANWAPSAIVAHVAESVNSDTPTWTNTGITTETCYGWFTLGIDSGLAGPAQRFDVPRVMSPGVTETIDPYKLKLKTFT